MKERPAGAQFVPTVPSWGVVSFPGFPASGEAGEARMVRCVGCGVAQVLAPQPRSFVSAGGGEQGAIWAERHPKHCMCVAGEGDGGLASG
jgi:hypothetical protein